MKAVLQREFGGIDTLFVGEVEDPIITPTEVLVRVQASALNRADILQREGKYPPPKGESNILGLEASGEIIDTGDEVPDNWQSGDKVMCLLAGGGYAEYVAVDYRLLMPIPVGINLEKAAAIPEVFLTAYQTLFWEGEAQPGETVLIHAGASGVGTAAIQLAKAKGLEVIITASESKLQTCLELGADHAINYKSEDFAEVIADITNDHGVNVILDFIGAEYFMKNLNSLATEGRLVQIAMMGGPYIDNVNLIPVLRKRLKIKGTTLRARSIDYKHRLINAFLEDFKSEFDEGNITPFIDSVFTLEQVKEAHARMEQNLNTGKIILAIG